MTVRYNKVSIILATLGLWLTAQTPAQAQVPSLQQSIETIISDPALSEATVGICVRTGDGRTLADIESDNMIMPASNMKLISTGAAIHLLGSNYQYITRIGYDGVVEKGILKGNLYIIGGGDPTTGSKDSIATPMTELFDIWEKTVRDAGIRRIDGYIIGDGRYFDGMPEHPSWQWSDIGTYYGSGPTGLMFYENTQSFRASAGKKVGDPVNIVPSYPEAPWMEFRYNCTTGKAGTGDQLYMYASDLSPVAEIRGTFGVDRAAKRVDCTNKFPEYTLVSYFADRLRSKGIPNEGPADFRLCTDIDASSADNLEIIGSTLSPALKRIIFETNHESNNLYAETLLRTLGHENRGSSCYDSSYVALKDVLRKMRIGTASGLNVQDGSGLSRQNLVSADFMCRFLGAMLDSPCFEEFLWSLPYPGGNGSLSYNMKGYDENLRRRIRVKSGSMNGVRCYSGYILPKDFDFGTFAGRGALKELPQEIKDRIIIFSVLTGNCVSPQWKVRPMLDRFMAEMAK